MKKYDMFNSPPEDYFRDRYMSIIDTVIKSRNLNYSNLKILDVGCGPGRLTLEFLKRGSIVDAVDALPELLKNAELHLKNAGLESSKVKWISGEIPQALFKLPRASYDLIICMEVLYIVPDPEASIKKMIELLSLGGILIISLRTRLYYLLHSLISGDWQRFRIASEEENSQSIGRSLSWIDPDKMEKILGKLSLVDINKWGLGILTGIEGDPTAKFCLPHELDQEERIYLAEVEDKIREIYPGSGRYIVFSGVKQ